jgi:hypothetical protein
MKSINHDSALNNLVKMTFFNIAHSGSLVHCMRSLLPRF